MQKECKINANLEQNTIIMLFVVLHITSVELMVITCCTFFGRYLSTMDSVEMSFIPNIDRRLATMRPFPEPGPPVRDINVESYCNSCSFLQSTLAMSTAGKKNPTVHVVLHDSNTVPKMKITLGRDVSVTASPDTTLISGISNSIDCFRARVSWSTVPFFLSTSPPPFLLAPQPIVERFSP